MLSLSRVQARDIYVLDAAVPTRNDAFNLQNDGHRGCFCLLLHYIYRRLGTNDYRRTAGGGRVYAAGYLSLVAERATQLFCATKR